MANKTYLDQEGLERLVQYINDALKGKANAGDIPEDVALKSDLADYIKADEMEATFVNNDELAAAIANVVRDTDIADVVRDSDIADVVRSNDIADVVRQATLEDYATNDDLDNLKTSLATVYHYRGSVDNLEALQAIENPEIGDVYNITDTGMNAGWTGEVWDYFGSIVDLTDYLTEDEVNAITIPTVDAILYGGKSAVVSDVTGLTAMLASDEPEVEAHLSENLVLDTYKTKDGKYSNTSSGSFFTVQSSVSVKLSGNSYLINCAGGDIVLKNGEVESAGRPVHVSNGTVTLNGAEVTSTADVAISATGANAKVIVNSGKVSAQESGVLVTTGAALEVNGGEIECYDNCPIQGNGSNGQGDVEIVMNGGKLVAHIQSAGYTACGVYMPNTGKFVMNGGEIISEGAGLVMRAGEVELNGGSIKAEGASGVKGKVGDSKVTVGPYAVIYDESAKYPGASAGEFKLTVSKEMVLEGTDGDIDVLLSTGASANIVDNRS